ncbi:hypothetical protein JCM19294_967 [Nonlabens tegetincola]|uniref:DUF1508 domain-containing protein n=1 Tax=Nonlabens tegetincola TaxID=323273 RepID=A0A090Q4H4_9FLAO|nr:MULTISPECIES: YegP family protein [Nonlabens]ALM20318.1 hypothetical protein AAT17_03190 [Nonlabens sp. MIC269]GAK96658.1 hypothetical protein JCM19294_967 [Nonlabens tegetincola]
MGKFETYKDSSGQHRFRLKAANGQNILASEAYTSKAGCLNGIESVRENSQIDSRYDRKKSSNGKHYFNLKASNGQVIGTSEIYEGSSGVETGIKSVMNNAPKAPVVEA